MANVKLRDGGIYSLYCYDCDTWVPNTANHEMAREGFFAHSHNCALAHTEKVELMRRLMRERAGYNWTFCYSRGMSDTEDTFKHDFPIAYEKVMSGETSITMEDMGLV